MTGTGPVGAGDSAGIQLARAGRHVAVVRLDRPAKRNAITPEMTLSIDYIVKNIESDDTIRAVVLAANGPVFCTGADLAAVAAGRARDLRTPDGGFAGFVFHPRAKPWIAAVTGPALAGGLELALACDMIVASPDATFGLPEVTRGIMAGAGGVFRLPRRIPRAIALEMIATGRPIDAENAARLGLVNRVVPVARVVDEAIALAETIAANAPLAVAESLAIARAAAEADEAALRSAALAAGERLLASRDASEGATAFVERRSPRWEGR